VNTRTDLTSAAKSLGIAAELHLVEPHRYQGILEQIIAARTNLGPQAIDALWWWESLREPTFHAQPPDPLQTIESCVDVGELVWFIAEERETKLNGRFWLYESNIRTVCSVLKKCPLIEYYVVSRRMDWILCENHHGYVIAGGNSAVGRLRASA